MNHPKGSNKSKNLYKKRININVVIMSAPHKFDFEISCNKQVKVCGRKQQNIMKIFNHTRIINMRS